MMPSHNGTVELLVMLKCHRVVHSGPTAASTSYQTQIKYGCLKDHHCLHHAVGLFYRLFHSDNECHRHVSSVRIIYAPVNVMPRRGGGATLGILSKDISLPTGDCDMTLLNLGNSDIEFCNKSGCRL